MPVQKFALAALFALGLAFGAPPAKAGELQQALANSYPAPELAGISGWINTEPLTLAALKGKVVLVDFWTYSCINCIRTFPHIRKWHETYKDDGLVVIGVHSPEFVFETKEENIGKAIKKHNLTYPVAVDNDRATWKAFANRYWPAHYLIDRTGQVVYTHFGEGKYDVTEHNIRALLGLEKAASLDSGENVISRSQTPETYLGSRRAVQVWRGDAAKLPLHHWQTSGAWTQEKEYVEATGAESGLALRFSAKKVFLVLDTADEKPAAVKITLEGASGFGKDALGGSVTVDAARLYELVDLPQHSEGTLHISSTAPGLRAYAFTFESDKK